MVENYGFAGLKTTFTLLRGSYTIPCYANAAGHAILQCDIENVREEKDE
jgi:hypothetical protein